MIWRNAARAILVLVLLAAPWWFGGVTPRAQLWLYAGVAAAVVLWLMGAVELWFASVHEGVTAVPVALIPAVLLLVCGALQIGPLAADPLQLEHAQLWDWLSEEAFSSLGGALSVCPAATRLELVRLCFALITMFLAADLFQSRESQMFLLTGVTVNGAVLAAFGVMQKVFSNGMLFWVVPLTNGGIPFASFVNRNNAAGYLNMCVACGVGLLIAALPRTSDSPYRRPGGIGRRAAGAMAMLSLIVLGVLAANSRGGIVALAAIGGATVLRFTAAPYRRTLLQGLATVVLIAVVLLMGLGFGESVLYRLATLGDVEFNDARPVHWADSLQALKDVPWFGLGLGTYHYAHKPYQSHVSERWYYNADGEYVEWLVETGLVGGLLWMVFLGLLFSLARRLLAAEHVAAASVAGTVVLLTLVGQLVHAIGDFGISLPASQLLAAGMCGMAMGVDHRLQSIRRPSRPVDHRRGFVEKHVGVQPIGCVGRSNNGAGTRKRGLQQPFRQSLIRGAMPFGGLLMLATSAGGLHELYWADQSQQFRESLPSLVQPEPLTKHRVDVALADAPRLLKKRHDDPEFLYNVARLWVFQLRWQLREQMIADGTAGDLTTDAMWATTHPTQIYAQAWKLRQQDSRVNPHDLLPPDCLAALEQSVRHLSLAKQACPLLPDADFLLGCLSPLHQQEDAEHTFAREVFLSPTDADLLDRVAVVSSITGLEKLAARCWRREATLVPQRSRQIIPLAIDALGEAAVFESVIPNDSAAMTLQFAERADSFRDQALDRVDQILLGQSDPESEFLRGRTAELRGETAAAIDHYQRAVTRLPLEINWRVRLARLFEQTGRIREAVAEWKSCHRLAPSRKQFPAEIIRLEASLRERPSRSVD